MSKQQKKTANPDRHKKKRRQIALDAEWVDLADALARRARQTTTTFVIGLIVDAAKAAGVEHPTPPWETDDAS